MHEMHAIGHLAFVYASVWVYVRHVIVYYALVGQMHTTRVSQSACKLFDHQTAAKAPYIS